MTIILNKMLAKQMRMVIINLHSAREESKTAPLFEGTTLLTLLPVYFSYGRFLV